LGQILGDGSCITGSVNSQPGILNNVSRVKAIGQRILVDVSFVWISVTELLLEMIAGAMTKSKSNIILSTLAVSLYKE